MLIKIIMIVNGQFVMKEVEVCIFLVYFFCDNLQLIGIYVGCDISNCGACIIFVDGNVVKFCIMFVVQADGLEVIIIEGFL